MYRKMILKTDRERWGKKEKGIITQYQKRKRVREGRKSKKYWYEAPRERER